MAIASELITILGWKEMRMRIYTLWKLRGFGHFYATVNKEAIFRYVCRRGGGSCRGAGQAVKTSYWRTRSDINKCEQKTGLLQPSSKPYYALAIRRVYWRWLVAWTIVIGMCCGAPLQVRCFFPSPPHFCQSRTLELSMTNTTTTVTPQPLSRCIPGRQDGEGYG